MKKISWLGGVFLLANILFADPFGLKMGMTLQEIEEKCGGEVECFRDGIYFIKPPRPSEYFVSYDAWCAGSFGLHTIAASTPIMSYKDCMLSLKTIFVILKNYYGESQEVKQLKDVDPVYMTSESPDTIYQYAWKRPECIKLEKEKVYSLYIWIVESEQDVGCVRIMYFFDNHKKLVEARNESPPF